MRKEKNRRKEMKKNAEKISCQVCKKLIPKAVALHPEGQDYVLNFCSIECMDYWKEKEEKKEKKNRK